MRALRTRLVIEHPAMQHDFTWLRLELLRRLASGSYPEDMARQAFDVFFRARNEVVLYDDVLPALTTLHTRCRLFALSNGNADLAAIGLSRFFERSLCAREAGCSSPTRGSSAGCSTMRVSMPRTWCVGDDPKLTSRVRAAPVCARCGSTARAHRGPRPPPRGAAHPLAG